MKKPSSGVEKLRALFAEHTKRANAAGLAAAASAHATTAYNLALAQELNSRKAVPGWTIDLNDGKLKPASEVQPYHSK